MKGPCIFEKAFYGKNEVVVFTTICEFACPAISRKAMPNTNLVIFFMVKIIFVSLSINDSQIHFVSEN
jgi:hypothetical protein